VTMPFAASAHGRKWHIADIPLHDPNVRYWGQCGPEVLPAGCLSLIHLGHAALVGKIAITL
jgi:hypothetical protein